MYITSTVFNVTFHLSECAFVKPTSVCETETEPELENNLNFLPYKACFLYRTEENVSENVNSLHKEGNQTAGCQI